MSADDGTTWTSVWSRPGVGLSSLNFDTAWNARSISLAAFSGKTLQIRFRMSSNGGSIAPGATQNDGFFIDDITVLNAVELVNSTTTTLASNATSFTLNQTTAGSSLVSGSNYYMSIAPRVGTRLFPTGALKSVIPSGIVVTPVVITSQPSSVSVSPGTSATLSVTATGTEPLSYQWRKAGVTITGATSAFFNVPAAQAADAANYDVLVTNPAGTVTSTSAAISVPGSGSLSILGEPANVTLIKGTTVTSGVSVEAAGLSTIQTLYQVYTFANGAAQLAQNVSGVVPATGVLALPLRSISNSGDYTVRFTRTYADGSSVTSDTLPFHLDLKTWDDAVGSYAALLEDTNNLVGDAAHFRGLLSVTVSRTGAISGKLQYLEAGPLSGGEALGLRAYIPVTRTFTGTPLPKNGQPLVLTCAPKLANSVTHQELAIELDCTTSAVALKATVKDHASISTGINADGCTSQALNCVKSPATLPVTATGVVGRYVLETNASASAGSDKTYYLVQVAASGKVLWTSRAAGYAGSGTSALNALTASRLNAPLFETRIVSGTGFYSKSLFGLIHFNLTNSVWASSLGTDTLPNTVESQSCNLTKTGTSPTYSATNFASGTNWSGVTTLAFSDSDGCVWSGAGASTLASTFVPGNHFRLTLQDPLPDGSGNTLSYTWNVVFSTSGIATSTGMMNGGIMPPTLSLRLDKTRAELTGAYTPEGSRVRRTVIGAALNASSSASVRARGWCESEAAPAVSSAAWTLIQL